MFEHQQWSSTGFAQGEALRRWRELVSDALIPCEISPRSSGDFHASMTRFPFGQVTFQHVNSSASRIARSREQVMRDRSDRYFLIYQHAGRVAFSQGGRDGTVAAGDSFLISGRAPYWIESQDSFIGLSMSVPATLIEGWLPEPEAMTGKTICGQDGWGRALAATMANFLEGSPGEIALPPPIVTNQILAQMAIALGKEDTSATRHQRTLLRRLGATLSDRFREPDFDPSQLAEEHGLSKRYVHLLFAKAGTSFGRELAKVRLENARRLLEDRRFDCVDIMEIALRCGFRDSSGFSKRFRVQYGFPPSAYRRSGDHRQLPLAS